MCYYSIYHLVISEITNDVQGYKNYVVLVNTFMVKATLNEMPENQHPLEKINRCFFLCLPQENLSLHCEICWHTSEFVQLPLISNSVHSHCFSYFKYDSLLSESPLFIFKERCIFYNLRSVRMIIRSSLS